MLGVSAAGLMGGDGGMAAAAVGETRENGGASGGSSEIGGPTSIIIPGGGVIEESDRSGGGGNRWPRQETLALLKIRSDMDGVFKDANLKGPLWEEVSRKMGELGFQRNPKKCKEKFENVYKYHKRTKDGRASKPDSKSYRFFDQLEAFETVPPHPPPPNLQIPLFPSSNVSSSTCSPTPLSIVPPIPQPKSTNNIPINNNNSFQQPPAVAGPSSSTTSSDEDIQRRRGRKRKWKDYFERLMREVVQKQEDLQNKFLEALERRERDRAARDEAWRAQESARIDRERSLLAEERSTSSAKDKAMLAFLHKVSNQHNLQIPPIITPPVPPVVPPTPTKKSTLEVAIVNNNNNVDTIGGFVQAGSSSSRWPKAEVEALIRLRTSLEVKYQENGPKGPLWEEISRAMGRIGYSRNPKRCKEKWENINKYYKKVKESNRKRPQDSKTCPYFQMLEEIYRDRAMSGPPIMARPEQQWPLLQQQQKHQQHLQGDASSSLLMQQQQQQQQHDNNNNNESDDDHDQNEELDEEDDDEEEEGVDGYEIIANKQQQTSSLANTVESSFLKEEIRGGGVGGGGGGGVV